MRRRLLSAFAVVALLVTVLPGGVAADSPSRFQRLGDIDAKLLPGIFGNREVSVILELAPAPVAVHQGEALQQGRSLSKAEKDALRAEIKAAQDGLKPAIASHGGIVLSQLQDAYDGVKVRVASSRLPELAALPGVVAVHPVTIFKPETLTGVPYIGGTDAWTRLGLTGKGVKIADIDTGIDFYHANFGGTGNVADFTYGAAHSTDFPAKNADATTAFPNAKVVGGYDLVGDDYNADPAAGAAYQPVPHPDSNPLDCNGHGSHTAGIAAGEGVLADGSTYSGPYTADAIADNSWTIGPGVAPEATIYAYRVFGCEGSSDVVVDAINMAVRDGVDVINMSLGSTFGRSDTPDAVASNNAALAGVVVVASAGNDGGNGYMVGSPASAARALAVAAMDPAPTFPGASIGISPAIDAINANNGPLPVTGTLHVVKADGGIALGCDASDYAGTAGQIVVTRRGDCDRVARAKFGQAAGSAAVIMVNNQAGLPPFEGTIPGVTIPFLGVLQSDAAALLAADGTAVTITAKDIVNPGYKAVAGFSSGGPSSPDSDLKPEVAAPGVSTFSTFVGTGTGGERMSGTSMACPFTTGSAALVRQAHPDWTVAQIKAALIDTADNTAAKIVGYNDRKVGAGVVQVQNAASTVAMLSTADGLDTLSFGYDAANAAYADTRQLTITNTGTSPITYTFSSTSGFLTATPDSVTVPAGASRNVNVKFKLSAADVAALPSAETSVWGSIVTVRGTFTATPSASGPGIYSLNVPFLAAPRGLSSVTASGARSFSLSGTTAVSSANLANGGPHQGNADVYAWGLHDASEGMPSNDIRDVGVQSIDAAAALGDASYAGDRLLTFAINTYGRWSNGSVNEFDVPIYFGNHTDPDAWVIGLDYGYLTAGAFDGRLAAFVTDAAFHVVDIWVADAPMNGSTVLLSALATGDLGLTATNGAFRYGVTGYSVEGYATDQVAGTAAFDAFAPAFSQGDYIALDPGSTAKLSLSVDTSKLTAQPGLGWMVVTMDDANGAAQADEIELGKLPKK